MNHQRTSLPTLSQQMTLLTNVHGLAYKDLVRDRLRACDFKRTSAEVLLELYNEAKASHPEAVPEVRRGWFEGTEDYVVTPSKSSVARGV